MQFFEPYKLSEDVLEHDVQKFEGLLEEMKQFVKVKSELGKIFNSIHYKLNKGQYSEEILDSLFKSLDKIIPFDRIGVAILDDDGNTIRVIWVKSKHEIKHLIQNRPFRITEDHLVQEIINKSSPVIINNLQELAKNYPDSEFLNLAIKDGLKSTLICPSLVESQNIGLLFFSSHKFNTYQEAHVQVFQEVAEGISLIVFHGQMKQAIARSSSVEKVFKNIIHDLNNPLTVIRGYLSILEKGDKYQQLEKNSRRVYSILKRNTDSMMKIVEELVYVKNESPQAGKILKEIKSLNEFLAEVYDDAISMTKRKSMEFQINSSNGMPEMAYFDHLKLKRAILNLVSNAVKFSNPMTQVTLEVSSNAELNRLYFLVIDKGQGIPENELTNLFKEQGQTSARPTAGEESSGRGLANVKAVVEAHSGQVIVKSKVGEGSTFGFWIPIEEKFVH